MAKGKKPRTVREGIGDIWDMEGPLQGVEARIIKQFGKRLDGYESLTIEQERGDDYENPGEKKFVLYGTRLMTEKELAREQAARERERVAAEKERARIEEYERQQLERLMKKYGGDR